MTIKSQKINYQKMDRQKIIIIGAGPAGISAAVQLKRANQKFLLIAEEIGGLVRNANWIENLIGFPEGISGSDYVELLRITVEKFKILLIQEKVHRVEWNGTRFIIKTPNLIFSAEYLIVGTGTLPKSLNIPKEKEAFHQGLLYYDRYKIPVHSRFKSIGIIGGGDASYDYALALKDLSSRVDILQRSKVSTALPLLIKRVEETTNISIHNNFHLARLGVSNSEMKIFGSQFEKSLAFSFDILVIAIGRRPNIDFLSDNLKEIFLLMKNMKMDRQNISHLEFTTENSYISGTNIQKSNNLDEIAKIVKKIWFIGDLISDNYRQISIALGDGVRTAMALDNLLR